MSRLSLSGLVRRSTHRGGSTLVILIVAVLATATAALGPTYDAAARTSILRDSLASAPVIEQGTETTAQGVVAGTFTGFSAAVNAALSGAMGDAALRKRLFEAPIDAIEGNAYFGSLREDPALVWRTDVCAHLQVVRGRCPTAAGEVMVSQSLARGNHWALGQRLTPAGWGTLSVVGIYAAPDVNQPYWFDRGTSYFPAEDPGRASSAPDDGLFAIRQTLDDAAGNPQGIDVVDQLIDRDQVTGSDLGRLDAAIKALSQSPGLADAGASVATGFPTLVDQVRASWQSLAVPVLLVSVQTLLLIWLLLYLVMTDEVEARGPEIALVKLRGFGRWRVLAFGLADPVTLLAIALPVGVLLGWGGSAGLARVLLRPGTVVGLPALSWWAALAASVGGLSAVVVAAQRTLRRPVVEQWRRAGRRATDRGWVLDAVVLTGAIAGLVELAFTGSIGSVGHGSLGLLVPALLGLAFAVIASRLLPLLCRAAFGLTRGRGDVGAFLAVRYVARRPGGVRTTIILATAFALATFGVAAWSIGNANRSLVADVTLGAPTVISVNPAPGTPLASTVAAIDPVGNRAMAVDSYVAFGSGGVTLLGVDPARFARIASWRGSFAAEPLADLTKALDPPEPAPIVIDGNSMRVRLDVAKASPLPIVLVADLAVGSDTAPVEVDLGAITQTGPQSLTGTLSACPCLLRDLALNAPSVSGGEQITGSLTIAGIDVGKNGTFTPLVADSTAAPHWRNGGGSSGSGSSGQALTSTSAGLRWPFDFSSLTQQTLTVVDRPDPLPAIVSASLPGSPHAQQTTAFDATPLIVDPLTHASAVPGSPSGGIVVDRSYAEIAAGGDLLGVNQQVWTTSKAAASVESALRSAGVRVLAVSRASTQATLFDRQGPGLASVLYLADAGAAVLLAVGGAVLGLVIAGRRRRYEYAALIATGARRGSLYRGLLLEQSMVLVFGAVVGIGAGVVAAVVAVRSIPEFVVTPVTPRLVYTPAAGSLAPVLAGAVVVLLVVAALTSRWLLAGVRSEQLREGAP